MVKGIDSFREWFRGYEDQYVIIGGTACDLLMTDGGLENIPMAVRSDMRIFLKRIVEEDVDLKQLGIRGKSKESILNQLMSIYG